MSILKQLQGEARFLRHRRLLMLFGSGLLALALPALLFGVFDLLLPVREATALLCCGVAALVGGVYLLWRAWRLRGRLPKSHEIALQLEEDCPEFMDSLVCAAEVLESGEAENSELKKALLRQVEKDLADRDLRTVVRKRELPRAIVFAVFSLAAAGLAAVWMMPIGAKAKAHLLDRWRGEHTGITVLPGDVELAAGEDLVFEAKIHRGPQDGARIILHYPDGQKEYDMFARADGLHTFEIYGEDTGFTYHIETPTLRSPAYRVATFRRPTITGAVISVTPPAYTRKDPQTFPEVRNVTALEGSEVVLSLTSNLPVAAALLVDGEPEPRPLTTDAQGREHRIAFTADASMTYTISLEDREGHVVTTGTSYRIEVLEDLPPIVRVTAPEKSSSVHDKDEEVPVTATVTDDYGIGRADLLVDINGNGWKRMKLHMAGNEALPELEKMVAEVIELNDIVDYGDVVSYYIEAADNATPKPHVGRSEIRFLEIRPPKLPPREMDGEGKQKGQQLSVADLIVEQKRLIKQTFGIDLTDDSERRNELLDDVTLAAGNLYKATRERFEKIKEGAKQQGLALGKFEKLFDDTVRDMDRAHDLLDKRLGKESLQYQQAVLSHLVKIEIELQKNAVKSKSKKPSEGKGEESEPNPDQKRKQDEKMAQLRDTLRELKDLIERQDNLNQRMDRGADKGLSKQERNYLSEKERQLGDEADRINRKLRSAVPESYDAARELSKAADQMREAKKRIDSKELGNAARRGGQAKQYLERSRELLEELQRNLTGEQLAQAQKQLEQLRREQEKLRRETESRAGKSKSETSREEAKEMAGKQKKLLQKYKDLLNELDKAGEAMEQSNPKAAEELAKGMRDAQDKQTGSKMKRAENALKYRQLKRAGENQKEVEKNLEQLSKALERAGKQGPQLSPEQLSRMLSDLMDKHGKLEEAGKGKLSKEEQEKLSKEIQAKLKELSGKLKSKEMGKLAQDAKDLGKSGKSGAIDPKMEKLVAQAAAIIERKLLEAALRKKLKLSRIGGRQPPDEYRKLVQEYFKKLSEMVD